jgi:protein-disulfide isomerase
MSALHLTGGKTTIVEFMDFQCPPCRAAWPHLKSILKSHPLVGDRAVMFPLRMHPLAFDAAVASVEARQGTARLEPMKAQGER